MTKLTAATVFIHPDEKCGWLIDSWRRTTDKGDRRVQRILVLRGDAEAVYEQDVGPWNIGKDHPFQFPTLWEYTVAEAQEVAMQAREGRPVRDPDDKIDLIEAFGRQLDERLARRAHRSVFGPLVGKRRA